MKKKAILGVGVVAMLLLTGLASAAPSVTVETTDDGKPLDIPKLCFGFVAGIEEDEYCAYRVQAVMLVVLGPPFVIINEEVKVYQLFLPLRGFFIVAELMQ